MHYNKQCNKVIQNGITSDNNVNSVPSIDSDRNKNNEINTTLSFEVNTKNRNLIKHNHEDESDIEKYNKGTTTSCTSSTDSGVNISDNDEIPPSPISSHLHSFPSTNSSSSGTTTTPNLLNKQFHKNFKSTNRDNSNKNNNNLNQYKNHVFNDDDNNDDDENISSDIDNKLKIEQYRKQQQQNHFINGENSNNGSNNSRYYQTNLNNIESENEININHQQHLTTATPTITVTTNNNDTPSLQQNEFINRPQRSPSISSSLSMSSSNTNSYKHNPPSNMHHCNGSPVVSIRSINSSTIITDSDSDSDLNGESEGVHENYVIKKLGTQVSYPPNHPNIPHINSGQTVLNQRILPNDDHVPLSPLRTLASIGDNIGAAQALGPVPTFSAVPQRPQIGSIALSNSSDVTFGDKHFYEGPVTIQQFLIDSRDKWKETNGNDNPTFQTENGETINNAKDINSKPEPSSKRKKLIIAGVLSVMVLVIIAAVLGSKALSNSKNTSGIDANDENECTGNGTLCLIDRDVWRAHPSKPGMDKQVLPLYRVVIAHTATDSCHTLKLCAVRVRLIQEFHMDSLGWSDIGYNFLISSDGKVYVGRGWDIEGAHTKGYNKGSVGIAFIGTFTKDNPTKEQLEACQALLEEGVRLKKLTSDYRLYGARQLSGTESPGLFLYNIIKKWPHWTVDVNL